MATSCEAEQHISQHTIDEQNARSLTRIALTQAGVPAADADKVADALVDTSLRGIDTHGLRLLPATNLGLPGSRAAVATNEELVS